MMPLTMAQLSTAYQILPNRQTLILSPKNPDADSVELADCVRRPWSKGEIQNLGAGIESDRAAFLIPAVSLGTTTPKNGDTLVEDDSWFAWWWNVNIFQNGGPAIELEVGESLGWTILSVTRELESTMFRCPCIEQVK